MKKFFCYFVMLLLIVGALSAVSYTTVSAATAELLINPGFEEGDTGWKAYAPCTGEVVDDVFHSGTSSMLITARSAPWGSYRQSLNDILTVNGQGDYTFSVWVRLAEEGESGPCTIVLNTTGDAADAKQKWFSGGQVQLTTQWQKMEYSATIDWSGDLKDSGIYVQTGSTTYKPDIYVDDFSLVKTSAVNGKAIPTKGPPIAGDASKRSERTAIGAIRWDAWYGEPRTGSTGVQEQVEKSLSPAKYHWRVPFFATITNEGGVFFPNYTQETMDKEILYAADAGIDYWAYVWYENDTMGKVRKLYETSQYRDKIKMCSIFDGNPHGKATIEEIKAMIQAGCWQTVQGGRPLMYYFTTNDVSKEIAQWRSICSELGVPAPYAVLMGGSKDNLTANVADAVSDYAIFGSSGKDFKKFSEEDMTRKWKRAATDGQMVPCVSAGWNNQPRRDNPVAWVKDVPETSWVADGTPEQIANNLMMALQWCAENEQYTMANAVIMYAWNENDEGGWISPTLAVDSNGKALKNADGTNKIDTSRLDAIKKVISQYKTVGVPTATPKPTPGSTRTPVGGEPTAIPTEIPKIENNKMSTPLIIGAISVLVIGAGAGTAIVLRKKRKPLETPTDEPNE